MKVSLNFKLDRLGILKIIIMLLITSFLMATVGVGAYTAMAKPRFYEQFMNSGNQYLQEGKYVEAVLEFNKAIKIEPKTTEARVGAAKGYIGNDELDKAIIVLKEAQKIDANNENLLKEIIYILKDIDPESAYEFLQNYINSVGKDNISEEIKNMLLSANELPQLPQISPPPNTYMEPINIKLISNKIRIGHTFFYTTDGSEPNENSIQYKAGIDIKENTQIRFIGFNHKGEKTPVITLSYNFDFEIKGKLEAIVDESNKEYENTIVGSEIGNCIQGAKEELLPVITSGKELLSQKEISADIVNNKINELNAALNKFKDKIIVPTDRNSLKSEISIAKELLNSSVEGSEVGQYRVGSKEKFQKVLNNAISVLDNLVSRQQQIDTVKNELTDAINRFKSSRITEMDKIFSDAGAKTGKVTISLLWNTQDDLDLSATSPRGDTVSFNNKNSSSGGHLDVDRQVNTFVRNPIENIYWDNPPIGRYTINVNIYTKRSSGNIPFKVRVLINGESKIYEMNVSNGMNNVCTIDFSA